MTVRLCLTQSYPPHEPVMNVYTVGNQTRIDDDTDLLPPSARQVPQGIRSGVGLEVIRVSKLGAAR